MVSAVMRLIWGMITRNLSPGCRAGKGQFLSLHAFDRLRSPAFEPGRVIGSKSDTLLEDCEPLSRAGHVKVVDRANLAAFGDERVDHLSDEEIHDSEFQ